ncbi:MAG: protein translocase subunit SecF [Alphaproteobacteria bacterium]|nr:protein translocase subunit SecF [Alphaproteobacteria bacterium]
MRPIKLLKSVPKLDYFRHHKLCFAISIILCLVSVVSLATRGLNYGVDFAGGIMIEVRMPTAANLGELRQRVSALNVGDVSLQEFGSDREILIRVERQAGGEQAEMDVVRRVRESLGEGVEYRRVEVVGPKVGAELIRGSILAVALSLVGILGFMAFRYGWQASVSGVIALLHDCVTTVGLFSVTGLQFDLNTVAAVVTIAGFSINDTVVIDDRIRENSRKFKRMDFREVVNLSVNQTMSRTIMTNGLLFLAALALFLFGGPVLQGLNVALLWGVIIGTYSTVYVAAPLEWYLVGKRRKAHEADATEPTEPGAPQQSQG